MAACTAPTSCETAEPSLCRPARAASACDRGMRSCSATPACVSRSPEDNVVRDGGPTIKLRLKVVPSSSRTSIDGWLGDTLKIRVTAPPERGKANAAVEAAIAEALGVSSHCVRVVSGQTSARKVIEVTGLSESEVHHRLGKSTSATQSD